MTLTLRELTKDINSIDIPDILSCWHWLIGDITAVHTISVLGDIFLIGKDKGIYWLQSDCGKLSKIADNNAKFEKKLSDEAEYDEWFLPQLVEKLIDAGKILKENEVYSYNKLPVIGGEYSVENIEPTDMSVHFAFSGQICEQIKNLPDGTKVNIVVKR
jgi:hypothetical protein